MRQVLIHKPRDPINRHTYLIEFLEIANFSDELQCASETGQPPTILQTYPLHAAVWRVESRHDNCDMRSSIIFAVLFDATSSGHCRHESASREREAAVTAACGCAPPVRNFLQAVGAKKSTIILHPLNGFEG